jgi:hypothetical protein
MPEQIVEKAPQSANKIQVELMKLLTDIDSQEAKLDHAFVKLGVMLDNVRADKLWEPLGYDGYNAFIKVLAEKFPNAGRTKLYACARIADTLLDHAKAEDIESMGMSKASKLASAIKKSDGKKPSDSLLQKAKDSKVTVQELDRQIADEYQFKIEFENGSWVDLSGVYMNPEEKEEFNRGVRVACLVDPPVNPVLENWQDNSSSHLRKDVLFRWVREFLATYEPEVNRQ